MTFRRAAFRHPIAILARAGKPAKLLAVVAATALLALSSGGLSVKAYACISGYCHWYVTAGSGYGTTGGTAAYTLIWSSFYVDKSASGFADEAVWLVNYQSSGANFSDSLEAGIYSGLGNNIPWTTAVLPYDTYSNGNGEHDVNDPQSHGARVWMALGYASQFGQGCGSCMEVGSYYESIDGGKYNVQTPRWNYSQGEVGGVPPQNTDMCGGYDTLDMQFESGTSGSWYNWGYLNLLEVDSPYGGGAVQPNVYDCGGS